MAYTDAPQETRWL